MAKVPVADDASTKSYYKYYEMGIEGNTPEQMQYIMTCKGTEDEGLPIGDRAKVEDPGTIPARTGFYPLKEGGLLVAGNIPAPDLTADMMYWWFAWHGLEPLRYAIWDPEDHYNVRINEEGRARALDPSVPMEEKAWGASHVVTESIGGPPDEITLNFMDPASLGYDMSKIGQPGCCEFLLTAECSMGDMQVPVHMALVIKKVDGIMNVQQRFWIGYKIIDGVGRYVLPPEVQLPEEIAMGLVAHNLKEYANLNKILPLVYAEEKDKPMI